MKKTLAALLALVCGLSTCTACSEQTPKPQDKGETVVQDGTGICIWDHYHPGDSRVGNEWHFSTTLPELNGATVEKREDNGLYLDGENLMGGPGHHCMSLYLCDLTGDDVPELCVGSAWGSGRVHEEIAVYDYATRTPLFTLMNRGRADYFLFLREGMLCVKEMVYVLDEFGFAQSMELHRTGVLTFDTASGVTVAWDAEVTVPEYDGGAVCVWDVYNRLAGQRTAYDTHPISVALPDGNTAILQYQSDGNLYLNQEILVADDCTSIYLTDLTGDGYDELCIGASFGSGVIHEHVFVYDAATGEELLELGGHDYRYFLRDGWLCVWQKPSVITGGLGIEIHRTGVLTFDPASGVSVAWDDEAETVSQ